jgi:hypothetical protein
LGPKNLIGGDLLDLGPGRLVEHPEQVASVLAGLERGSSPCGHARDGNRPRHDVQEPACDAEADPLGLGNDGELALLLGGDLDGVTEPFLEDADLGSVVGELVLEFVDAGLGRGTVHGVGDLLGLAVERLP